MCGNASSANTFDVRISGGKLATTVNGATTNFTNASGLTLKVTGGTANDKVNIAQDVKVSALVDVKAGNDTVNAGAGNDTIYGGPGIDHVNGGPGNDITHDVEDNYSAADGGSASAPTTPSIPATPATPSYPGGTAVQSGSTITLTGIATAANTFDVRILNGKLATTVNGTTSSFNNTTGLTLKIVGGSGNDRVTIADTVTANANVTAGAGNDSVKTGGGNDSIYGGTGTDTVNGGPGTDFAYDAESVTGATSSTVTPTTPNIPTTPTTPTNPTGANNPPTNGNFGTPTARITAPTGLNVITGQGVHVDGLASTLNGGQPTTARYEWNFGDSGSEYNTLVGYNAAHVYDRSGTYTVTLRVINEGGKTSTTATQVTVSTNARRQIYVSNSGNDSNAGTASAPIKSWTKVVALAQWDSNIEVLFKRGETFSVTGATLPIHGDNVAVGGYGSGSRPVLKYTGPRDAWRPIIAIDTNAVGTTVQGIAFDSIYTTNSQGTTNMPVGMFISGKNTVSRDNTFGDMGFAHDVRPGSIGTLVLNGTETKVTGLRDYYMWVEGSNVVALGNTVPNSTRQHIVRMVGATRVLVADNDFANLDRRSSDGGDDAKGVIVAQKGSYYYVSGNRLNGPSGFGPLGKADGLTEKNSRTTYGVFEANYQQGSFELRHGSEHMTLRNNVFSNNNSAAVLLEGYSSSYGRGSLDLQILNNTGLNNGTNGQFLLSYMPVEGIKLVNNLYVAPQLTTGQAGAAGVAVYGSNLNSFTKIDGNNWGMPTISYWAEGGINTIGSDPNNRDIWQTPAEWNAWAQVGTDQFTDIVLGGNFRPNGGQAGLNGVVTGGVFTDMNGSYRPSSGWTVGAVQV